MRAHAMDGLIGFAGCDKTLPAMMMAMVRLNCPSVFVYGGAMLPGHWQGRDVTVLTAYEGVGRVLANGMSEAELAGLERACAPTVGACLLFAFADAVQARLQGTALPGIGPVPVQLIQALPYVLTVALLAGFVGRAVAPRAIGIPYVKER